MYSIQPSMKHVPGPTLRHSPPFLNTNKLTFQEYFRLMLKVVRDALSALVVIFGEKTALSRWACPDRYVSLSSIVIVVKLMFAASTSHRLHFTTSDG